MSIHAVITPAAPLPRVALERSAPFPLTFAPYDPTTQAVLCHLLAENAPESARSFDELMAICWKLRSGPKHRLPLFLKDPNGVFTVEVRQFSDRTGRQTPYTRLKEGGEGDETRRFIREWLLRFLEPFRALSRDEVKAAADGGKFRYLGILCYQALSREVRKRKRLLDTLERENLHSETVSLDYPLGDDAAPQLHSYIGTRRADAPSSWPTAEVSLDERVNCGERMCEVAMANAEELARLDVLHGVLACAFNIKFYDGTRSYDRRVTRAIAAIRRVSIQRARQYRRRFVDTMKRELAAGNLAVRALFLETEEPISPQPFLTKDSYEAEANRGLFREKDSLQAQFEQDCIRDGLSQNAYKTPPDLIEQQKRDAWEVK